MGVICIPLAWASYLWVRWDRSADVPRRFVIYSALHSGTHFLREGLAAPPDVTVGDEVFTRGLPAWVVRNASHADIQGQTWVDPEHYVSHTVLPVHRFYLGLTDLTADASRGEQPAPRDATAQIMHEPGWLADELVSGNNTWRALQARMNRQRALGLLWNHWNEAREEEGRFTVNGGPPLDWGPHVEGVFHSVEYLRYPNPNPNPNPNSGTR